jgi:hypothetical protein
MEAIDQIPRATSIIHANRIANPKLYAAVYLFAQKGLLPGVKKLYMTTAKNFLIILSNHLDASVISAKKKQCFLKNSSIDTPSIIPYSTDEFII